MAGVHIQPGSQCSVQSAVHADTLANLSTQTPCTTVIVLNGVEEMVFMTDASRHHLHHFLILYLRQTGHLALINLLQPATGAGAGRRAGVRPLWRPPQSRSAPRNQW